jgi:hypothetical protein
MGEKVFTPVGILSFPALFEARSPVAGADPRYSVNLIFDKEAQKTDAYKALKAAIEAEAADFFKGKVPANARMPIRDAGEKSGEYAGYEKGCVFISAWTKTKPGLVGPKREEITTPEDVWAGQKARASVKPFGYNQSGNKGVGLMLNNVQIAKYDMPRLDGRAAAKDEFSDLDNDNDGDDEIPF